MRLRSVRPSLGRGRYNTNRRGRVSLELSINHTISRLTIPSLWAKGPKTFRCSALPFKPVIAAAECCYFLKHPLSCDSQEGLEPPPLTDKTSDWAAPLAAHYSNQQLFRTSSADLPASPLHIGFSGNIPPLPKVLRISEIAIGAPPRTANPSAALLGAVFLLLRTSRPSIYEFFPRDERLALLVNFFFKCGK